MVKTIQSFRVTPKEPDEVLVQRQLESWLDPGWCMTTPAGRESKVTRKRKLMLWRVAGVLMLLGLVGLVSNSPMGGLISIALVLVIVIALVALIQGIVIEAQKDGGLAGSGAASLTDADDLARFEGEGGLEALEPDRAEPQERLMAPWKSPKASNREIETVNERKSLHETECSNY